MDGLNLPLAEAGQRRAQLGISNRRPRRPSFWRSLARWLPFLITVGLPTLAATIYYCAIATPQFVSEARFVVRGPSSAQPGMLSSLLQGTSLSRAQDDTFSVQDYVLSRDALHELVRDDNLRTIFSRPEGDVLARFPNFLTGDTFEYLYKYYLKHVDVVFDSTTGVSKLTVQTFRAEDSARIATALLAAAENLVNRMNDRERENALHDARKEVARSEETVKAVAARIAAFRNRETMIDPTRQSAAILQGISELQMKLALTRTQLGELEKSSPNSPLIASAQRRVAALQAQIDEQSGKVAGSDQSMVPKITEYDALSLERQFADRELASATASLEAARAQSERQQLYLDPIVQPNVADYPAYPQSLASIAIVFASFFGIYTICKLIVAGAREHRSV